MLKIQSLAKTYPNGIQALDSVSLKIESGIFGLLGPNGAGKSTLLRTIGTLQLPDSGTVHLGDLDVIKNPRKARELLGYLPQDFGVYPRITAREMLDYLANLKGIQPAPARREEVLHQLEKVNLLEAADQRLDSYSGGMKQRFGIAAALLGKPKLVIVDEPTAGLDPQERRRFQLLLTEVAKSSVLILSSHIVEDIAGLCTNMAIMHHGQIVKIGSPSQLTSELKGKVRKFRTSTEEFAKIKSDMQILSWLPQQGQVTVHAWADGSDALANIPTTEAEPTLEDLYALHTR